jgi:hypothetical protein
LKPKRSDVRAPVETYAVTNDSTKPSVSQSEAEMAIGLLDDWFDPFEAALREQARSFIQAMIEAELEAALARPRYGRRPKTAPDNTDGPRQDHRPPPWPPIAIADRDIWSSADRDAAGEAQCSYSQEDR